MCCDSALHQAQHVRFFVLVHLVVSLFWSEPCAQAPEKHAQVSWARLSVFSDWALTANLPRGLLRSLLCDHTPSRKRGSLVWNLTVGAFWDDLSALVVQVLGVVQLGSRQDFL